MALAWRRGGDSCGWANRDYFLRGSIGGAS